MKRITLYEDKKEVATVPYTIENLLMLHTTFKLETLNPKQEKYAIRGIRE